MDTRLNMWQLRVECCHLDWGGIISKCEGWRGDHPRPARFTCRLFFILIQIIPNEDFMSTVYMWGDLFQCGVHMTRFQSGVNFQACLELVKSQCNYIGREHRTTFCFTIYMTQFSFLRIFFNSTSLKANETSFCLGMFLLIEVFIWSILIKFELLNNKNVIFGSINAANEVPIACSLFAEMLGTFLMPTLYMGKPETEEYRLWGPNQYLKPCKSISYTILSI